MFALIPKSTLASDGSFLAFVTSPDTLRRLSLDGGSDTRCADVACFPSERCDSVASQSIDEQVPERSELAVNLIGAHATLVCFHRLVSAAGKPCSQGSDLLCV